MVHRSTRQVSTVQFLRRTELWRVLGVEQRSGVDGELTLASDELNQVHAVDVVRALRNYLDFWGRGGEAVALIGEMERNYLDDEEGPFGPINLIVDANTALIRATMVVEWPADDDEETASNAIQRLSAPYLAHRGATLHAINVSYGAGFDLIIDVDLETSWRGKSVADLVDLGAGLIRLSDAHQEGFLTPESAADLIRGGAIDLLIGQEENNWLDAKAEEYDLSALHGQISLAQAVTRFCNSEQGGVIIFGAKAKQTADGEVIRKVRGVPNRTGWKRQYQGVVDRLVYPPPYGMRLDTVPVRDGSSVFLVEIPPQPEEMKPFLVHGAILPNGDVEGAFISIVQRRGEGSIPLTAPMIHTALAVGRALLRNGSADTPEGPGSNTKTTRLGSSGPTGGLPCPRECSRPSRRLCANVTRSEAGAMEDHDGEAIE